MFQMCIEKQLLLVVFAEIRKKGLLVSLRVYVRPSTLRIRLSLDGFHIFTSGKISKICREISGFIKILGRITSILHERLSTFMIISRSMLLRIRNVLDKLLQKMKTKFYS
jgi:hypothetical protein